jgi:hypothetical protein
VVVRVLGWQHDTCELDNVLRLGKKHEVIPPIR